MIPVWMEIVNKACERDIMNTKINKKSLNI